MVIMKIIIATIDSFINLVKWIIIVDIKYFIIVTILFIIDFIIKVIAATLNLY